MLQLHGDEGPAFCAEAARRTGARVIKARAGARPGDVQRSSASTSTSTCSTPLSVDAALRGGTGETFDWELLARAALEGAADPQRRPDAGERRRGDRAPCSPYAVDIASGTEAAPGHKDPAQLRGVLRRASQRAATPRRLASGGARG